ncbi:MAG: hypothetical protein IPM97_05030 [Bdellovibrionaceae bacterium]|nr:hypothetical protein [Pseudobdellovibrionaceae bacterium]
MKKSVSVLCALFLVLFNSFAFAEGPACTPWTLQDGVSCMFAGQKAHIYQRTCQETCSQDLMSLNANGLSCFTYRVCYFGNPQDFNGPCSAWHKEVDSTCFNPTTNTWEQKWERACLSEDPTTWCSKDYPL